MATKRLGQERQIELAQMVSFMEEDETFLDSLLEHAGVGSDGDYERFKLSMARYWLNGARNYIESVVDTWFARDDDVLVIDKDDIVDEVHDVPVTVVTPTSITTSKNGVTKTEHTDGTFELSSIVNKKVLVKPGDVYLSLKTATAYRVRKTDRGLVFLETAYRGSAPNATSYDLPTFIDRINKGELCKAEASSFPEYKKEWVEADIYQGDIFHNKDTGSYYKTIKKGLSLIDTKLEFEMIPAAAKSAQKMSWETKQFLEMLNKGTIIRVTRNEWPDVKSPTQPWTPAHKDKDKIRTTVEQIIDEVPEDQLIVPGFQGWCVASVTAAISGKTDPNIVLEIVQEVIDGRNSNV